MRSCGMYVNILMSADQRSPGWTGFSRWVKKGSRVYPPIEMLARLGKMGKVEREKDTWFGMYLWEAIKQKEANVRL